MHQNEVVADTEQSALIYPKSVNKWWQNSSGKIKKFKA